LKIKELKIFNSQNLAQAKKIHDFQSSYNFGLLQHFTTNTSMPIIKVINRH